MAMLLKAALGRKCPWVYVHHDWHYKLAAVRRKAAGKPANWAFRCRNWRLRLAEEAACRASSCVATASTVEKREIELAGQSRTFYLPLTYSLPKAATADRSDGLRIIHLGKASVTSNRIGLTAYLTSVHPRLKGLLRERNIDAPLWVVGDCSAIPPDLRALFERHGTILKGYVPNLSEAVRPFDLAIIPFEGNTGVRTKFTLLLGLSAVVVTTAAAVSGISEARGGENCVVLESLGSFPEALADLAIDFNKRRRIGEAARASFEAHFTLESLLPTLRDILDLVGKQPIL
jgi:glycosyltransferase involved in cell wall biosynthesis